MFKLPVSILLGVGGAVERKEVGGFETTGGTGRKTVTDRSGEKERGRRKRKTKKRSGKRKGNLHNFFFAEYAVKVFQLSLFMLKFEINQ